MDIKVKSDGKADVANAAGNSRAPRARGIDRVVHILDHLFREGRPMRINEIAKGIGAPRSSVYEIADTLVKEKILEVFDAEGRVFLGRKLYYFGRAYTEQFDLTREAGKHLKVLTERTGETSQLCMTDGAQYSVVMMNHGNRHFKISSDIGEIIPLPWTASARLLLSRRSAEEITALIPEEDFVLPNGKRLSVETLLEEIRKAAPEGFFSCDTPADSYTHCFAAPVLDENQECIATLCLVVPREDARTRFGDLKDALIGEARSLSKKLGGRGPGATAFSDA
ncbi:MAG: IclR family transcriptional regulator [Rhodospirillales bacterium]|nr:IclR family transcriptional regulator [Rhodospirillales bacterium]